MSRYVEKVYSAKDGEEALLIYKEQKPSIVVADIRLPKISGLEVSTRIRENDTNIPIVIITAHDEQELIDRAKELKISTYVKKPFRLQELTKAIEKAISEL